ncbi:MAG: AarF/ABC1/UbiB kinase family protein [Myxococcota bacterium]
MTVRDRLPTGLAARATATARIAANLGRAGARRLVRRSDDDDASLGDALFRELDQLKGLGMKVGQILSYMEVGLPEETVRRLTALQHGVSPLAGPVIVAEVERQLGAPIGSLFDRFDPTPIAAASIGQVHRAAVRGVEVAVKVRYPGVRASLDADTRQLRVIGSIAALATVVDGQARVSERRARLLAECDYRIEAANQARFAAILAGDPALSVPEVVADRSAEGVLTTAWRDGERFDAVRAADPARRAAVAATLVRFPWSTVLGHGVLHADPHPGNFLFPGDDRVVVLDFGCVKRLDPADVAAFRRLVQVVLDRDRGALLDAALAVGLVPRPDKIDADELWAMLSWMLAPYRTERFRFDRAFWDEGQRFTRPTNPNARWLGFPPAWLWLQRTLFGLHAVLTRLGVEGRFAELARAALASTLVDPPGAEATAAHPVAGDGAAA